MSAAEPVKNPQGLAPYSDHLMGTEHSPHQTRHAKATQKIQASSRGPSSYPDNRSSNPTSIPPKRSPIEVGKVGDTDRRTSHRLRRGKLSVDARLDLHGCTVAQAHDRLLSFLRVSQSNGARCVLVVTGKGGHRMARGVGGDLDANVTFNHRPGKLRTAVPDWLNDPAFRPMVLSVSHAAPRDGGEGALYILLRKADAGRRL